MNKSFLVKKPDVLISYVTDSYGDLLMDCETIELDIINDSKYNTLTMKFLNKDIDPMVITNFSLEKQAGKIEGRNFLSEMYKISIEGDFEKICIYYRGFPNDPIILEGI